MKNVVLSTLAPLAAVLSALSIGAQTYNIPWHSIGPGGAAASGIYAVSGSVGQWGTGKMSGGNLNLNGGFWAFASAQAGGTAQYNPIALGTLGGSGADGYPGAEPYDLNNLGQIVGYSYTLGDANWLPAFWTNASSSPLSLGTLGSDFSEAYGMSDLGQIVGYADLSGGGAKGPFHAVIWANNGAGALDLGSLGGNSAAVSINNPAQIVGWSYLPGNANFRAVFWPNTNSPPLAMATLGGVNSAAVWINDSGQIVGNSNPAGSALLHAVYWTNGSSAAVDLGTLGNPESLAVAINGTGQIVGYASTAGSFDQARALYWTSGSSSPQLLDTPAGDSSEANAINNFGQIVGLRWTGSFALDNSSLRAVIWANSGSPAVDLNTLIPANSGWILQYANAINDSGEIVGVGTFGGQTRGFALSLVHPVATPSTVNRIAAGGRHSLFVESDGSLWGMGYNALGQLGTGAFDTHVQTLPLLIHPVDPMVPDPVAAIAAGNNFSLFLKADGSLWAMGENTHGQLGDGTTMHSPSPVLIMPSIVSAVAAGSDHALFLKSDGSLWAMGNNGNGQLGDGTTADAYLPELIDSSGVTAIAGGYTHSLFIKSDGSLWAMGYNGYGGLGDGSTAEAHVPKQIVASGVTAIAAGEWYSLFLKSDGSLWGMGYNSVGQLGDGTTTWTSTPEKIVASGVTAIAAGPETYHSLFLKSDGSLWAMGYNYSGELGDGTTNDSHLPEMIVPSSVTAIASGQAYSLFMKSDGSLWAMGYNAGGQLGDGTQIDSHVPERIIPSSVLRVTVAARSGNDLLLSFTSRAGHTYNVLSTSDLSLGAWSAVQTGIPGNDATVQVTIPTTLNQPRQFFIIQETR